MLIKVDAHACTHAGSSWSRVLIYQPSIRPGCRCVSVAGGVKADRTQQSVCYLAVNLPEESGSHSSEEPSTRPSLPGGCRLPR